MKDFSPMLADRATPDLDKLTYPLHVSPKLDGFRCTILEGQARSRNLKPFPNRHVSVTLSTFDLNGFDGELCVGSALDKDVYNKTQSGVSREDGEPDVTFHVFDWVGAPHLTYRERRAYLESRNQSREWPQLRIPVVLHPDYVAHNAAQVLAFEEKFLDMGYEGLILRSSNGVYKYGRSTQKEQGMLKFKRFVDSEGEVINYEEEMFNGNAAFTNELGRTARSSEAAGLVGKGALGALVCRFRGAPFDGAIFRIGTGFTAAQRLALWADKEALLGKIAKFKYFPVGSKLAPRHPVFLGWREAFDLS